MTDTRNRLDDLERRLRRLQLLLIVFLVLTISLLLAAATTGSSQSDLDVRQTIVVRDREGRIRVKIGELNDGSFGVKLLDEAGHDKIELADTPELAVISLSHNGRAPRVVIAAKDPAVAFAIVMVHLAAQSPESKKDEREWGFIVSKEPKTGETTVDFLKGKPGGHMGEGMGAKWDERVAEGREMIATGHTHPSGNPDFGNDARIAIEHQTDSGCLRCTGLQDFIVRSPGTVDRHRPGKYSEQEMGKKGIRAYEYDFSTLRDLAPPVFHAFASAARLR